MPATSGNFSDYKKKIFPPLADVKKAMFQRRFFLFYAFNCTVISLQPSRFGPDAALIYFHAKPTETPRGGRF